MVRFFAQRHLAAVTAACAIGVAPMLRAEKLWVQPESAHATPGAWLYFDILTSEDFSGPSTALGANRVERAKVLLAGEPLFLTGWVATGTTLRSSLTLARPGVAVADVLLQPEARSIARDKVERYLRELHAGEQLRAAWDQIEPPNPWQEVRTVRLKTYARVGTPANDDRSWAVATSDGLDLTPGSDPTAARVDAPFVVRLTRDGKPVAGVVVEFLSDGEAREHVDLTGDDGRVAAPLNQAGPWLVRCFEVKRVHAANHDWETGVVALCVVASP